MASAVRRSSRARDHRDPSVDDDDPVEELVERAHLGPAGGDRGDVLVGDGAAPGAVLVERAHPHAALERGGVAPGGGVDGPAASRAGLRLGGQQLVLALRHLAAMKALIASRPWTSVKGPRPAVGERRQIWASQPNAWAHWDDSVSSWAPAGRAAPRPGTGRCPGRRRARPGRGVGATRPSRRSRSKAALDSRVGGDPRVAVLDPACGDDLLVEPRGAGLEEGAVIGTEVRTHIPFR